MPGTVPLLLQPFSERLGIHVQQQDVHIPGDDPPQVVAYPATGYAHTMATKGGADLLQGLQKPLFVMGGGKGACFHVYLLAGYQGMTTRKRLPGLTRFAAWNITVY